MKSKLASRIALSILVVLPVVASSSYAAAQESSQAQSEKCRNTQAVAVAPQAAATNDLTSAFNTRSPG